MLEFPGDSRAKQSFKEECDINNIMEKYKATGLVDHVKEHRGTYKDMPSETDYHTNLNTIMAADAAFASLPAALRAHFDNDAAAFVGFVTDPDNQAEINEMGLGPESRFIPPEEVPAAKEEDPPKETAEP